MTDQLSLRFEPALPNLPANLRPMLARPLRDPFDSTDYLFEPSWGGRRALAFIGPSELQGGGAVAFIGEDGASFLHVPSELAGIGVRFAARSAVVDGELVVVDPTGRADPDALARRLAGDAGRPVAFLVFDLLHCDGRSLLNLPLDRRHDQLRRILRPADEVLVVPAIPTEGRALFDAVAAQGLAGVLARRRGGPYLPGARSRLWRFIPVPGQETSSDAVEPVPGEDERALGAAPVLALIRRLPLGLDDPVRDSDDPDRDLVDPGRDRDPA